MKLGSPMTVADRIRSALPDRQLDLGPIRHVGLGYVPYSREVQQACLDRGLCLAVDHEEGLPAGIGSEFGPYLYGEASWREEGTSPWVEAPWLKRAQAIYQTCAEHDIPEIWALFAPVVRTDAEAETFLNWRISAPDLYDRLLDFAALGVGVGPHVHLSYLSDLADAGFSIIYYEHTSDEKWANSIRPVRAEAARVGCAFHVRGASSRYRLDHAMQVAADSIDAPALANPDALQTLLRHLYSWDDLYGGS